MKISGAGITAAMEVQQYKGTMNQTTAMATDSETKSFQNQIENAQAKLQKLSSDNKMSSEEKAKKHQK